MTSDSEADFLPTLPSTGQWHQALGGGLLPSGDLNLDSALPLVYLVDLF